MIGNLIKGIFGSSNERELKRMAPIVDQINRLEPDFQALSDEQLKAKTVEFKERIENGESLDELLPEAFAAVRETSVRVLDMRHFDVQFGQDLLGTQHALGPVDLFFQGLVFRHDL